MILRWVKLLELSNSLVTYAWWTTTAALILLSHANVSDFNPQSLFTITVSSKIMFTLHISWMFFPVRIKRSPTLKNRDILRLRLVLLLQTTTASYCEKQVEICFWKRVKHFEMNSRYKWCNNNNLPDFQFVKRCLAVDHSKVWLDWTKLKLIFTSTSY